jgi:membrane associated rhomboid family serine protease
VTPSRQRADEWAVVLAAAGTPHRLRRRLDGWAVIVPPDDVPSALASLAAYDQENSREGTSRHDETTSARPMTIVGAVVALLLIGFFAITGPRAAHSTWFERGSADATRMMEGEWWRAITALTLHADAPHLAGNAAATVVLVTAVCWYLGPGVGLWLLLLGGRRRQRRHRRCPRWRSRLRRCIHGHLRRHWHPRSPAHHWRPRGSGREEVMGRDRGKPGSLAFLGTGPHADLLAHLFGFLLGLGLGLIAALTIRWIPPAPVQWLLAAAAAAAVVGAWRVAF